MRRFETERNPQSARTYGPSRPVNPAAVAASRSSSPTAPLGRATSSPPARRTKGTQAYSSPHHSNARQL
eukprot:7874957-Lingulodinium_polyedra.AAC.1